MSPSARHLLQHAADLLLDMIDRKMAVASADKAEAAASAGPPCA